VTAERYQNAGQFAVSVADGRQCDTIFTGIDESHGRAMCTACERLRLNLTAPELPLVTGRRGSMTVTRWGP